MADALDRGRATGMAAMMEDVSPKCRVAPVPLWRMSRRKPEPGMLSPQTGNAKAD
jgi:hypothetical protein